MIDFFFSSAMSKTNYLLLFFGYFIQILGMFEDLKCYIWCLIFVGIWYAHGKLIVKYFMVMYTLIM